LKISIITVSRNSVDFIAAALESVNRQTWRNLEHWVIDGASSDATLDVVGAHIQSWRHVVSEPDDGIYDAMNKGIRFATGDVIGFINSDDFYASPTVLESVASMFQDSEVQACWGDLCYVRQLEPSKIVRYWRSSSFVPGSFARGWCPPHPTFFVRREVLERFGAFDLNFPIAADMELMARLIEVHRIRSIYIPHVLVHMRMGGTTNRSVRNIWQQNREIWAALKLHRLNPSLLSFVGRKLLARARQFMSRPAV
jgi:glycosyltransferase involved in cell wall biosynthesis